MSESRIGFLPLTLTTPAVDGRNACVFGAFGVAYVSFYFSYLGFSKSLPAGQGIV